MFLRLVYLNEEAFDVTLELVDGVLDGRSIVFEDGESDDVAGDTSGAAKGGLGGDEDVGNVLVFAEEGEVEENLDGVGVAGHDDEFGLTAVEGLGGFVGTLLDLLGLGGVLDEVEDFGGELSVSEGVGLFGDFSGHFFILDYFFKRDRKKNF